MASDDDDDDLTAFLSRDVEEIEPSEFWGHVWGPHGARPFTTEEQDRMRLGQCPFHGNGECSCTSTTLTADDVRHIVERYDHDPG